MNIFFIILTMLLSAACVFATAYFLLNLFFKKEHQKHLLNAQTEAYKQLLPLRMQAYERMVLFLERIAPNNLLLRTSDPYMNAQEYQIFLIRNIREEFEHNVAQQLYISSKSWELIKMAKEEMLKCINSAASKAGADAKAINLSQIVIEDSMKENNFTVYVALNNLKEEAKEIFFTLK